MIAATADRTVHYIARTGGSGTTAGEFPSDALWPTPSMPAVR
jgi:hypothetical protein